MTDRKLDDLLLTLRDELAVAPSAAFAAGVRQRIAVSSRPLQALAGVVASFAVLVVALFTWVGPLRQPEVPTVPRVGRVALPAPAPEPSIAQVSLPVGLVTVSHAQAAPFESSAAASPVIEPAAGPASAVAASVLVFASDGVWMEAQKPVWTESTVALVAPTAPQWTTVTAVPGFEPVEFPKIEFPQVTAVPISWPVAGEERH